MTLEKSDTNLLLEKFEDAIYEHISFIDFKLRRLRKLEDDLDPELPFQNIKGNGIIIKTVFEIIEQRNQKIAVKTYFLYKEDDDLINIQKMDKRGVTSFLKDEIVNFIKKEKKLNNNFQLSEKSSTKKGIVKYEMIFSGFVSFNLSIKPEDLETESVSLFIVELPIEETSKTPIKTDKWKIEYAKSSRSTCKKCNEKIMKDSMRLGQPHYFQDHLSYKWHHLECNKLFNSSSELIGLEDLRNEDIKLVERELGLISTEDTVIKPNEIVERIISEYANSNGLTDVVDVYKHSLERNISKDDVSSILESLEEEGRIYYPEPHKINLI